MRPAKSLIGSLWIGWLTARLVRLPVSIDTGTSILNSMALECRILKHVTCDPVYYLFMNEKIKILFIVTE